MSESAFSFFIPPQQLRKLSITLCQKNIIPFSEKNTNFTQSKL